MPTTRALIVIPGNVQIFGKNDPKGNVYRAVGDW